MYSNDDLRSAVSEGIFSADAVAQFQQFIAIRDNKPTMADEENFRLINSFNDIFVVIACGLLLGSMAWLLSGYSGFVGAFSIAITSWLLAEYFVRIKHMALPAIVLLLSFVIGAFYGLVSLLGEDGGYGATIAAAITAALTWLHWRRFVVPITVAAGTSMVAVIIVGLFVSQDSMMDYALWAVMACGCAVFVLAMVWDSADITRTTRNTDVAFWLHLLAAPMIAHPIFMSLGLDNDAERLSNSLIIIGLYFVTTLISLVIDRRAFMAASMAYVIYALRALFISTGTIAQSLALTCLILGASLLLLAAFWQPSRRLVLELMPDFIKQRVPAAH